MISIVKTRGSGRLVLRCAAILWAISLVLSGCGSDGPVVVSEVRTVERPSVANMAAASSAERFGMMQTGGSGHGCPTSAARPAFSWKTPAGWHDLGGEGLRVANFNVGPGGEASCYITVLGGAGGGVALNVNRWRSQVGLAELSGDEIDALPKIALLGGEAVFVDIFGTYGAAADDVHVTTDVPLESHALLGAILVRDDDAVFLRMTGPKEILQDERGNFILFAGSVQDTGTLAAAGEASPDGSCCPSQE